MGTQPIWIRVLVGLATAACVGLTMYAVAVVSGVPEWVPDAWVPPWPGL